MEIEIGTLDLRYEALRSKSAARERRLLAAIASCGQQVPIVVVRDEARPVVVDGYKRVRVLRRLGEDTVKATAWELDEAGALVLEHALRDTDGASALEQGWLLRELAERFGLCQHELSRRFDRTPSWVSRRLALVRELPESVQRHVRAGHIGAHAAMKHLVPLARANAADCARMIDAVAKTRPTSRQIAELCATYAAGTTKTRNLVVSQPEVVLKARRETSGTAPDTTAAAALIADVRVIAAVARRVAARIVGGALDGAADGERDDARRALADARAEVDLVTQRFEKETSHAG